MSKEEINGLLERKISIDDQFMYYSHPSRVKSNYQALANLALIGGRLDALIRQAGVRNRETIRNAHRTPGGMPRPNR